MNALLVALTSPSDLDRWCANLGIPVHEGRERFAGVVILACIASHPLLGRGVAFKGGNALRFFYQSPRSTSDLDFSALNSAIPDDESQLRTILDAALLRSAQKFNVKTKCQKVKRNPKENGNRTHPTYSVTVGYQFAWDRYFLNFESRPMPQVLRVEISLSDVVCECEVKTLQDGETVGLNVCTICDIVAEKLRSLLQQPIRHRHRRQDVYDIARIVRNFGSQLDKTQIKNFLLAKSHARNIDPKQSSFDGTIRGMAEEEYALRIKEQAGDHFIPFDEAWKDVESLVASLGLPS